MTVLVTGCSTGFGLLIAQRFLAAGDTVIASMRTPSRAPAELEGAHVVALDVVSDRRSMPWSNKFFTITAESTYSLTTPG